MQIKRKLEAVITVDEIKRILIEHANAKSGGPTFNMTASFQYPDDDGDLQTLSDYIGEIIITQEVSVDTDKIPVTKAPPRSPAPFPPGIVLEKGSMEDFLEGGSVEKAVDEPVRISSPSETIYKEPVVKTPRASWDHNDWGLRQRRGGEDFSTGRTF